MVGRSEVVIKATPEEVFDFVGMNFFANYPRWSPEVVALDKLSDGSIAVGTMGRQVRIDQRRRLESRFEVTRFDVGQCFEIEGVPDPFRCAFELRTVEPEASTHVTFIFEGLELRPFMRPFEKLIRRVVQDGAVRTTRNVKRLIEVQKRRQRMADATTAN